MIASVPDVRTQGIFMSSLFAPIKLGNVEFSNRVVVSPMCQYSADDGSANDWHLGHLGMLANSGAGLVIVEATHVERRGRITHGCTGLYSDHNEAAMAVRCRPAPTPGRRSVRHRSRSGRTGTCRASPHWKISRGCARRS
jgi:hypothetical protein